MITHCPHEKPHVDHRKPPIVCGAVLPEPDENGWRTCKTCGFAPMNPETGEPL